MCPGLGITLRFGLFVDGFIPIFLPFRVTSNVINDRSGISPSPFPLPTIVGHIAILSAQLVWPMFFD